jgi:hypothetical protein
MHPTLGLCTAPRGTAGLAAFSALMCFAPRMVLKISGLRETMMMIGHFAPLE